MSKHRSGALARWSQLIAGAVTLAVSLGLPSGVWAQEAGSPVSGRVVGEDGTPLADIRVELIELGRVIVSDDGGSFRFPGVSDGRYTLRLGALGRRGIERPITVAGAAIQLPDVMLPIEAIPLTPLRVVEQRTRLVGVTARVPGSTQVVTSGDLESAVSPFDDVHQVLRRVPGVNVQEEDGYGLRPNIGMRGSGSDRSSKITLMEDGVLIAPAPYSAPSAYYFPIMGRMDAIEIRKGSSQVKYGPSTIGGALNLVSSPIPNEPFDWFGEVAGAPESTHRVRAKIGGGTGRFGWQAEAYHIATDGFKQLAGGGDTGFRVGDYLAKLRWSTDPEATRFYQHVELKLGVYDERSNETYLGLTDRDFRTNPLVRYAASQADVMHADHRQFQLRHFMRFGERLDLTTTVYRNEFSRNWYKLQSVLGSGLSSVLDDPAAFAEELSILRGADSPGADLRVRANNRRYYAQGVQTTLGARVHAVVNHDFELGVRAHEDQEDRFQHEDGFRMAAGRMALEEPGAPGSQSNRLSDARAWSIYLEDRIELGTLSLTPGVRFETIDFRRRDYAKDDPDRHAVERARESSVSALLPGIGASLRMGPGTHVFAGIHRGFGPPGPSADDATEPERSVNYEVGFGFERPGRSAQIVGFYNDYGNVLGAATLASGDDGSGELFNGGQAEIWGVEAGASVDLLPRGASLHLPIRGAYTFTHAEFTSSFESDFDAWGSVEAGDFMPYVPTHQLFGSVGLEGAGWRIGFELQAGSAMRTVAGRGPIPDGTGTDAYASLGLGGELRVASWGALFFGIQNLTDARYVVARRPAGARPGLPRTIEAGVRIGRN